MTHGEDRATYRDINGRFTDNSGRLHATETQIETAKREMENEIGGGEIEQSTPTEVDTPQTTPLRSAVGIAMAGESSVKRDTEQPVTTPLRSAVDIAMAGESAINREEVAEVSSSLNPDSLREQEDLKRVRDQVNVGIGGNIPESSPTGPILEEVESTPATTPLRSAVDIAMAGESPVNRDLETEIPRDLHQEALDRNKEANQGFTSSTISQGFRDLGQREAAPTGTPLRTAVEIAMAGDGQIEKKVNQSERKITEEAVNAAIASGTPMKVKVQRTSGEIEDDWSVLSIFTDDNGIQRAKVVKFDPKTGLQLDKNVPVDDLEKLNSTEEGQPIGYFDSMMDPKEAKRYENSFGQLENPKTVQDIQREIREAFERASSSTSTNEFEGTTTTPQETVAETETTPNLDKKVLEALNQIISFIEETRKRFPNDPEVKKSADNIIINIGSLTLNINSVQSVATQVGTQSTVTQQATTLVQEAQTETIPEQQTEQVNQSNVETENLSIEDLERRNLTFAIEELTKSLQRLKEVGSNNPQVQIAINNMIEDIGALTVNINHNAQSTNNEGGANGGGDQGGGAGGGEETPEGPEQPEEGTAVEQNANQESRELSWEEQSGNLAREIAELDRIEHEERELTDAEKVHYFNLLQKKQYIDNLIISPIEKEAKAKRVRRERIIGLVAGAAGFGAALATAPLSAPALIAVTLGGGALGKVARRGSEKLRSKSTAMKYESRAGKTPEEIEAFEKKIKRNERWANRLGEASAAVIGGAAGFGLGKLAQNVFGWGKAAAGTNIPEATPTGEASVGAGSEAAVEPQPIPQDSSAVTEGYIETAPVQGSMGGATEGWLGNNAEWLDTSQFGWDPNQLGWRGSNIGLSAEVAGSNYGPLQKEFFTELSKLVSKEQLMGQANAFKVNEFLRAAYNGTNPAQAAQSAAQALLGN
jgi:hypothetical protein